MKPLVEIAVSGDKATVKRPAHIGMSNCRKTDPPKGLKNQRHTHAKLPKRLVSAAGFVVLATVIIMELQ